MSIQASTCPKHGITVRWLMNVGKPYCFCWGSEGIPSHFQRQQPGARDTALANCKTCDVFAHMALWHLHCDTPACSSQPSHALSNFPFRKPGSALVTKSPSLSSAILTSDFLYLTRINVGSSKSHEY